MAPWNLHRRELLRIGALSVLGSEAHRFGKAAAAVPNRTTRPQKNCIFIFLQGGPSHIDLWDPKPSAAAEVRGPFSTIETSVEGLRLGELMSRTASLADKLVLIRSMTHQFTNHIAGTYVMQTGSIVQPDADREAAGDDFPGPGAVLNWLQDSPSAVPTSVSLPNWLSIPGPSNRMPGQYGGLLGSAFDPFLIQGEPQKDDFKPLSLSLPSEIPSQRFSSRLGLLAQMDATARELESKATQNHDRLNSAAFELLVDPRVREALDLNRESPHVRDRYGRTKIGQSLLLARRLVEAGVRFVSFNEFNQGWDHHGQIQNTLKNRVPPMEQAFAALVDDLSQRGLLDSTLVVNTGEFGRTPLINKDAGRDHWPNVYTTVLAGAGLRGGQVYGASNAKGGEVHSSPVSPADFLATLWTVLGIDPHTELRDRLNRPLPLTRGRVVESLL